MKRKLIQLSPSTSVVSMPSQWIKKNSLVKGEIIDISESENKIIISCDKSKQKEKEITLDISKLKGKLIWTIVDAAYVSGYDSIIILTANNQQNVLLAKVVRYFPGMIIYDERKGRVHFKAMMGEEKGELGKILNRIFNLNISMLEDSYDALKNKDWEILSDMKRKDYTINTYISYCLRYVNKHGHKPFSKTGVFHSYVKVIEIMSDKLSLFLVALGDKKIKLDPSLIAILLDIYRHLQRMHFSFSIEKITKLETLKTKLKKKISKEKNHIIHNFIDSFTGFIYDIEELEMQLNL